MTFKELSKDYIVFLFDKGGMECKEAKVVSVSAPRFDSKMGQPAAMVVDLTLEIEGKVCTYVVAENTSKAFTGTCTIAIDRSEVVEDVKALKRSSEQALAEMDKHKAQVEKCNEILADLDIEYKEKQAMENRLNKIESMLERLMHNRM